MANNLTLTGAPSFVAGGSGFGQALSLNGSSQYATIAGTPMAFSAGASFTIVARVLTTDSAHAMAAVGKSNSGGAQTDIFLGAVNGKMAAQANGLNGSTALTATSGGVGNTGAINDGAWHTIALVVTASSMTLYIDGVNAGSSSTGSYAPIAGGTVTNYIGGWNSPSVYWIGQIDEVAIYSAALTGSGTTSPSSPVANNAASLLSLFHLDSGNASGATVLDCAGATFALSPTSGAAGSTPAMTFTGTGTQWSTATPAFSTSGGSGASMGSTTVTSGTAATATLTVGTAGPTLTVTDASSSSTQTFTVTGGSSMSLSALSATAGSALSETATGSGTSWTSGTTFSAAGTNTPSTAPTITGAANQSGTHETFTLNPGSGYSSYPATITVSDSVDGATATVQVYAAATAYTLSGPTSGAINQASSAFTVALPAGTSVGSAVVVTPSDGGAGGTFSPSTLTLPANTAAATASCTYTPTTAGARTISSTNNGGLTNPAGLTYTVSAPSLALSGPTGGSVGAASGTLTITASAAPGATLNVTLSDGGAGGVFTPSSPVIASSATSTTCTYTPSTSGMRSLSAAGTGYLTSSALSYQSYSSQAYPQSFSAPYGAAYSGFASVLGYTIYSATGALLLARTIGGTVEIGTSGIYVASVRLDAPWSGVLVWDAPAGAAPFAASFDPPLVTVSAYSGGQDPATLLLLTPANKLATDSSGRTTVGTNTDKTGYALDLAQAVPLTNTVQTVGDALSAARAQGFGTWRIIGGTTLSLYAPDGTTVVRSFTLDSATAPTSRI